MESKNQKIVIAIVIAAIIILAGIIFVLINQEPEPSPAEQMTLQPKDIGPGWSGGDTMQFPMDQVNESSICTAELGNNTINLYLRIDVFNTTNDSQNAFVRFRSELPGSYENISLGDEAVFFPQGTSIPGVIFVTGTVTAWVQTQAFPGYEWQKNATIDIALLQLDKIDQYLASHPGES